MRRRTKLAATVAALAALAVGGASLAGAGSKTSPPAPPAATQPQDGDNVQQGDQASPDTGSATKASGETPAAAEASTESSSEVANNDGPGGHADEPGNPNADHQFQGAE